MRRRRNKYDRTETAAAAAAAAVYLSPHLGYLSGDAVGAETNYAMWTDRMTKASVVPESQSTGPILPGSKLGGGRVKPRAHVTRSKLNATCSVHCTRVRTALDRGDNTQ